MAKRDDTSFHGGLAESFQLRMPVEVWERIEAAADASGRSMNEELLARIEASFSSLHFMTASDLSPTDGIERLCEEMRLLVFAIDKSRQASDGCPKKAEEMDDRRSRRASK